MFTGLIQAIGHITPVGVEQFQIACEMPHSPILKDLALGDSVAVDGICLTVEKILSLGFIASASPETLQRTTLGELPPGSRVNLEPSLRVGSKLGGHFVTGHIDGRGRVDAIAEDANAWMMSFHVLDRQVSRYLITKGSIAVNGVSLTVADCTEDGSWFNVAVIPVTYAETNLNLLQPGNLVNLEGDILGKYVEKFLRSGVSPSTSTLWQELPTSSSNDLTSAYLAEHGYM